MSKHVDPLIRASNAGARAIPGRRRGRPLMEHRVIGEISNKTRSVESSCHFSRHVPAIAGRRFWRLLTVARSGGRNVPIKMQSTALLRRARCSFFSFPVRVHTPEGMGCRSLLRFNASLARRTARETLRESGCETSITSGPTIRLAVFPWSGVGVRER